MILEQLFYDNLSFAQVKMKYIKIVDETPCTRCTKSAIQLSIYIQPSAKRADTVNKNNKKLLMHSHTKSGRVHES